VLEDKFDALPALYILLLLQSIIYSLLPHLFYNQISTICLLLLLLLGDRLAASFNNLFHAHKLTNRDSNRPWVFDLASGGSPFVLILLKVPLKYSSNRNMNGATHACQDLGTEPEFYEQETSYICWNGALGYPGEKAINTYLTISAQSTNDSLGWRHILRTSKDKD
jgi:hypothetical protein